MPVKQSDTDQLLDNYQLNDGDRIELRNLFDTLLTNKWSIILITVVSVIFGFVKANLETPIYQADAKLHIGSKKSSMMAVNPVVGGGLGSSQVNSIVSEVEIIRSRKVMRTVVKNLSLNTVAKAKYFPVIGKAVARRFERGHHNQLATAWLDYTEYAWGGEHIKVDIMDVPAHWIGRSLTLVAGEQGHFKIIGHNEKTLFRGEVGKPVSTVATVEGATFFLFISALKARPGTHFTLVKLPEIYAMWQLMAKLHITLAGDGMLDLLMNSTSPAKAMETLNEVIKVYARLDIEKKSAEAQNTLHFLEQQLPTVKEQLDVATDTLNAYRLQQGSLDLDHETRSILNGVDSAHNKIIEFEQRRDDLLRKFTILHPTILSTDRQLSRLQSQLKDYDKKISKLPKTQQIIVRLSRDVSVNSRLYDKILNNLQTIKISKAGTVGDVRVIDDAIMPLHAISPNRDDIIMQAFFIGLIIGIVFVLVRRLLHHGIEDPEVIEQQLKLPVYATIMHSDKQKKLNKQLKKRDLNATSPLLLALEDENDMAIESLRSLRTTLRFAFLQAKNNLLMITGPSQGVGKSFVAMNLAMVLASAEKKILLIDADLRKGLLNKAMGMSRENGLSEAIVGDIELVDAIHNIDGTNMDFISTGTIPANPSELLLHENFEALLKKLSQEYDYVIIDSPPILAVTDASIIGRFTDTSFMVVKSGDHPLRELQQSIKRLKQNNVNIKGFILNDIQLVVRYGYGYKYGYRYGYGKYSYQYSYRK